MKNRRKPIPLYMLDVLNAYQAAGHVVGIRPFSGKMSLDGFPAVSYEDAFERMREALHLSKVDVLPAMEVA